MTSVVTNDVMIDLETLGVTADSVILSIGAVKFDLKTGAIDDAGFYASISIDSNLDAGRKISEDTLLWWLKQPVTAQEVFHEPKQALEAGLEGLADWLGHKKRTVWANGPDFDTAMLAHAYKVFGWEPPWEFWNSRCVRTYKALPAASGITRLANDHNALRDAFNQAKYVIDIHKAMTGRNQKEKA